MEAQSERAHGECTLFARFAPTCVLSRCFLAKFLRRSSAGKFIQSVLLVGKSLNNKKNIRWQNLSLSHKISSCHAKDLCAKRSEDRRTSGASLPPPPLCAKVGNWVVCVCGVWTEKKERGGGGGGKGKHNLELFPPTLFSSP